MVCQVQGAYVSVSPWLVQGDVGFVSSVSRFVRGNGSETWSTANDLKRLSRFEETTKAVVCPFFLHAINVFNATVG